MPPKVSTNKRTRVSPKKNEDECGSCRRELDEQSQALSCDGCDKWLCIDCVGISKSEYQLFCKMTDSLTCEWFCPVCKVTGNSSLGSNATQKLIEATVSKAVTSSLDQFQQDLKQELGNINSKISNLESEIAGKCTLAEVESKLEDIVTSRLNRCQSDTTKNFESDVRRIIREDRERQKRQLNIVVYGVPESCEEAADILMFIQDHLAQSYNLPSVKILKPQRLGNNPPKPGDRPRPVLFLTDNYKIKKEIVTKSRELKGAVQFHFDRTKAEREKRKQIQTSKNGAATEH